MVIIKTIAAKIKQINEKVCDILIVIRNLSIGIVCLIQMDEDIKYLEYLTNSYVK